jgi:hypothetical protein
MRFEIDKRAEEMREQKVYGLGRTKKFGFTLQHLVGVNLGPDVGNMVRLKLVFVPTYLGIHLSQIFNQNMSILNG